MFQKKMKLLEQTVLNVNIIIYIVLVYLNIVSVYLKSFNS